MARIRTIKPEFFTSLTVASLPLEARLTFIGLWTHVDDEGRCVDDPRLIKAALWPLDDRVSADVEADLQALSESSLIVRYDVGERSFLEVRGWAEHQRINRKTNSKLPKAPPPGEAPPPRPRTGRRPAETVSPPAAEPTPDTTSHTTHAQLTEDSLQEGKGKEGKGKEELPPSRALDHTPVLHLVEDDAHELAPLVGEIVLAGSEPENAGQLVRAWVDYCTRNDVKLTNQHIKRYGSGVKRALAEHFTVDIVKRALAEMLADRVASRPGLLSNYLVRVQQGPELPPRRATPGEASVIRMSAPGEDVGALIHDALTRPA